jgi:hypothetical protein
MITPKPRAIRGAIRTGPAADPVSHALTRKACCFCVLRFAAYRVVRNAQRLGLGNLICPVSSTVRLWAHVPGLTLVLGMCESECTSILHMSAKFKLNSSLPRRCSTSILESILDMPDCGA